MVDRLSFIFQAQLAVFLLFILRHFRVFKDTPKGKFSRWKCGSDLACRFRENDEETPVVLSYICTLLLRVTAATNLST